MPHPYRYWLTLHPDIARPIGGAKQMHRLAEALNYLGREAKIIQEDADFHPGWFKSNVKTVSLSEFRLSTQLRHDRDIIILPETYIPALPKYAPGISKIIFNQNGAYSFGLRHGDGFPDPNEVLKLYAQPDVKHVLCISKHDEALLKNMLNKKRGNLSRVTNAIETKLFVPSKNKRRIVSYMPRKNAKDAEIVIALLKQSAWFRKSGWTLKAIKGLTQEKVAQTLQES